MNKPTAEQRVKAKYPEAEAVQINRRAWNIFIDTPILNSRGLGFRLCDEFQPTEAEAWESAAARMESSEGESR